MSSEGKNLVRSIIPGWIFIGGVLVYILADQSYSLSELKGEDGAWLAGAAIILAGAGLPAGYIIYQISMFFGWVSKSRNLYYSEEYELEVFFSIHVNGEKMRVRHNRLLETAGDLRAASCSLLLALIVNLLIGILYFKNFDFAFWTSIAVNAAILLIVYLNQRHYMGNLEYFKKRIHHEYSWLK
ncbi:hypothetical protein ACFVHQ_14350 [Actinomycetes bacterium NPDC127524]